MVFVLQLVNLSPVPGETRVTLCAGTARAATPSGPLMGKEVTARGLGASGLLGGSSQLVSRWKPPFID